MPKTSFGSGFSQYNNDDSNQRLRERDKDSDGGGGGDGSPYSAVVLVANNSNRNNIQTTIKTAFAELHFKFS